MSLLIHKKVLASSVRYQRKNIQRMKLSIVTFICLICDAFSSSLQTALTRVRRWENGDMGTSDLSNMFRGTAGVDYPDLKTIPNTNFRCEDQIYEGGLYADVETKCQVYHVCHDGRKDSFLCGKGTIFNQQILACDYWYSADCESAPNYYHLNSQIGDSASLNNLDNHSQQGRHHISGNPENTGGNAQQYTGSNQQPCCCLKNSNQRPWSFPAGMMHGDK